MNVHENKEYQKLIDELHEASYEMKDEDLFTVKLKQLTKIADRENDPVLKAIVTYHKGDIPYIHEDFDTCYKYVEDALRLCKEIDLSLYIMLCYNSLAVVDSQRANFYQSISNYLHAFHIAEAHPEYKYGCKLLNNIGNLFVWLNEYEFALDYLIKSYHKYYEEQIDSNYILGIIILNIVEQYSLLGNHEKADEWANIDIPFIKDVEDSICMVQLINEMDTTYNNNSIAYNHKIVDKVFHHADEEHNFIYVFRNYLRLLKITIREKDRELAERVINRCKILSTNTKIETFEYDFILLEYAYYETFIEAEDDGKIAKELFKTYVNKSEHMVSQLRNTYNRRIIVETELLKVASEKEDAIYHNMQLEKEVELDYFTHILNKVSLEKHVNEDVLKKLPNTEQALFLIDIDEFKIVNDSYGHNRGDEILLNVVEMISSCCSKNMLFGRFGGDEFIVYIKNAHQKGFFIAFAEELLERARQIHYDDGTSLTLSIGVYITDKESDNFKGMVQKADEALYEAKGKGRNQVAIYTKQD